jgi:hypothetical protein
MGCVEDDAIVDDLAIVAEGARVNGREILLYDEIARARPQERTLRPERGAGSSVATIRGVRQEL